MRCLYNINAPAYYCTIDFQPIQNPKSFGTYEYRKCRQKNKLKAENACYIGVRNRFNIKLDLTPL